MDIEYAKHLIDSNPREELETLDSMGWGWLHACVFGNLLDVAQLLVYRGFNINIKHPSGETPLDLAIRLKKPKFVCVLSL
jgi:ankyrin repeat protein